MDQFSSIRPGDADDQPAGSSTDPRLASRDASSRADHRDSLFLGARLRDLKTGVSSLVRVRNLSTSGLMAEYQGGLALDREVELELRGIGVVSGRVAWSTQDRIGVRLDRLIDPARARRPVGGKGSVTAPYRMLLRRRPESLDTITGRD